MVFAAALAGTIAVADPASAPARAGDLDPSFGNAGKAIFGLASSKGAVRDLAILGDERIVAIVGRSETDGPDRVVQFLANGHPDTSFGDGGVVDGIGLEDPALRDVEVDSENRILVLGSRARAGGGSQSFLARLLPTGQPDPNFAGDGFVDVDDLLTFAIQGDSRIVLGGGDPSHGPAYVGRLTMDGAPDPSFSGDGFVTLPEPGARAIGSVGVDDIGRIVALAASTQPGNLLAIRLLANGDRDAEFSGDPTGTRDICPPACGDGGIAVAPGGGIFVTAGSLSLELHGPKITASASRFDDRGLLDSSFGEGGTAHVAVDSLGDALVAPGGGVVFAQSRRLNHPGENDQGAIEVIRLGPDGDGASGFGRHGPSSLVNLTDQADHLNTVGMQSDGRIVAGGYAGGPVLVRYGNDGPGNVDADPVRDSADRCIAIFGTTKSGCPTAKPRVRIRFHRRTRDGRIRFTGSMRSAPRVCSTARIDLLRVEPGRDRVIARAKRGNTDVGAEVRTFRIGGSGAAGIYYTRTKRRLIDVLGVCKGARSNYVSVG